ncbi:MAG: dihydrofolate reductase family protein [Candidatus Omnitrophica bacterium]|nr:dihydrofolate reductase family protein [Candidatus Omnitrophota bacterium]
MGKGGSGRLYVVAKCAQTIDGKIATSNGQSKWITSEETRKFSRSQRDKFDAILVGIETVIHDNPRLTGVKNTKLKKIVVDSSLRVSTKAKLFKTGNAWIVGTTKKASLRKKNELRRLNIDVIECPSVSGKVSLKYLFKELFKRGIRKLLIEGGATIIGAALKDNLIDQLHVYIAPKIMGDSQAKSSVQGFSIKDINKICVLNIKTFKKLNTDIMVVADVYRNR